MSQSDDNQAKKENIIDFSEARKRQKEVARQKAKEARLARAAKRWQNGDQPGGGQKYTIWTVVQAVILLVMVYWLMQTCGR